MNPMMLIIDEIQQKKTISREQFELLLATNNEENIAYLFEKARNVAQNIYGNKIFIRGLIEFTNICKNNCYYCGIRAGNKNTIRYRLTKEEILECCKAGYALGFRTFVLQGGEDIYFTDEKICEIVSAIRSNYPDCAIKKYFDAGANRYLLRHETADACHYASLHPKEMELRHRIQCLNDLKEIGYQTGCGFMVGSPNQTIDTLYKDICFIKEFQPHMVGIGPFIPQKDTPFGTKNAGTMEQTLRLLSIIRLLCPNVLLPSTTALGTIHPKGRELGILAGANVVMPNLSPMNVRKNYALYDNKVSIGEEAAEGLAQLKKRMKCIGYEIIEDRGDYKNK